MRAHAHVEQHICRLKDPGLTPFPFASFCENQTWLLTVAIAANLVRWSLLLPSHRHHHHPRTTEPANGPDAQPTMDP